ncbi:alpha/beta-hydrolase [Hypoxylon sp. NC1633]|nr:alpha/beta-hydrolase [Hypoxylon sp. NC1633]
MDFSQWGHASKEWLAFAAANSALLSHDDRLPPLKQQKNANNARTILAKRLFVGTGLSSLVTTQDYGVPTRDGESITVRSYRPVLLGPKPLPAYVYYHGGGYVSGTPDTELFNCAWVAYSLSMIVVHICYRHTPQYIGLTAWHDALDGFDWVATHTETLGIDPSHIVVGGVSAGGSLTACVTQSEARRARETGIACRVSGQLLAIPNLIHQHAFPYHLFAEKEKTSPVQCASAPLLPQHRMKQFLALLGTEVDPHNLTWSPGLVDEEELRGLPQTAFLIAGNDPLRDEALWYAKKLKNVGVRTNVHIFPGLPHGFSFFIQLSSHKAWNQAVLSCLRWAAADDDGWIVEIPPTMPPFAEKVINASDALKLDESSKDAVEDAARNL